MRKFNEARQFARRTVNSSTEKLNQIGQAGQEMVAETTTVIKRGY